MLYLQGSEIQRHAGGRHVELWTRDGIVTCRVADIQAGVGITPLDEPVCKWFRHGPHGFRPLGCQAR